MKTTQKGFTLIELMIVIAIIAILAAIAIPAYQNYTIRSKVSEAIVQADSAKTAVSEFVQTQGHFPESATSAGIDKLVNPTGGSASQYVKGGSYPGDGVFTLRTQDTGAETAPVIGFQPVNAAKDAAYDPTSSKPINWQCFLKEGKEAYVPSNCRHAEI